MAPQAQAALFVERQGCNVVRVIARRTVTVFALNSFVRRTPMFLYIVLMTLETRLIALILDWKIFPFLDVAEPVVVVRKTITVDTEIVRNQELPGKQNQSDQCDCKPQWVQDMPLHFHLSLCRLALERLILISTTYDLRCNRIA
jgi:hypothetical protein